VNDWLPPLFFALLGAALGSFLNVCVARWPRGESVLRPPSRCPHCQRYIAWHDNIPILGWLLLGGRCRWCRQRISLRYPVVEAVVALGWLATALAYGPSFTALRVAVFGTVMLGIALTDLEHYLIPDGFTVFGLLWVVATAMAAAWRADPSPFAGPWDAVVGACAGAGAIAIVGWLGEVTLRREAMGFGDVTMMAVIGGAVGPERALLTIFVAALIGAFAFVVVVFPLTRWRVRREPQLELGLAPAHRELPHVPFGVFLAPAALLTLVWGQNFLAWYMGQLLGAI
jgi:leader peptidase (prepilin peptidase)/N-methyltransferase